MQAASKHDEGAPEPVVGPHQPVLDPEPPAEGERPRLLREEGVRAALDEEPLAALRLDGAAQPIGGLEHREVERMAPLPRPLHGSMSGGEPRDTPADDDQLHGLAGPRLTRSASISMKRG